MTRDTGENLTLTEETARRVLARAAELDGSSAGSLSVEQLRQIASEVGINRQSLDAALRELRENPSSVARSADGSPSASVPAWVRICMTGVPDRRIARGYYWLFLAGLIALPLWALLDSTRGGATMPLPVAAGMAFFAFALWSTSRCIRWLDRNGWGLLNK